MAKLSERKKKILSAVIEEYIASAEPVGSKLLAEKAGLHVSSATIRSELSELTALGYLEQPHTSAGRVPTVLGYRLYVNELMQRPDLSREDAERINRSLGDPAQGQERMLDHAGRLAADMTDYPALTVCSQPPDTVRRLDLIYVDANTFIIVLLLGSGTVQNKLVHLPFSVEEALIRKLGTVANANFCGVPESEIDAERIRAVERSIDDRMGLTAVVAGFVIEILSRCHCARAAVSGGARLLRQPEFQDPAKAHSLMDYLSDAANLRGLSFTDAAGQDIRVLIGPENIAEELRDSSVILAKYDAGDGMQGLIGVVGPTRMDYSRVAAKLSYIAAGLSRALADSAGTALPGFGKLMLTEPGKKPPRG